MSLGGRTYFAGRTLNDQMVNVLLANDILTVISAGNDGFSTMTGGSPGTSMSALTVGAASTPKHERLVRSLQAPCSTASFATVTSCVTSYRPDENIQVVEFSSRGPTHDGRHDPEIVANGLASFTQGSGTATTLNFVSGTSFSAPAVAGIATSLRQAVPAATARQVRNALIMSANPSLIPTATHVDQGAGFVDGAAALALLQSGSVPDTVDVTFTQTRNVQANMSRAGRMVYEGSVSEAFSGIRPAETAEIAYLVKPDTASLNVVVRGITPALPPAQQNQLFGDDVFLRIQGSVVHARDRKVSAFINSDRTYSFPRPEAGVWRITPTGDWTNAGTIGFTVDVWATEDPLGAHTRKARISHGETHTYEIHVPAGWCTKGA
jgi:hypothetical protein